MSVNIARHDWVKRQLRKKNVSLRQIAQELSVDPSSITLVSQGHRQSATISAAIARKLDKAAAKLWVQQIEEEEQYEHFR